MDQNQGGGNDKGLAFVAYILFFVPLLMGKRSQFVNYHTNQGTVLFIFAVVLQIAVTFLSALPLIGFFLPFVNLIPLVLWIIGLINVSKGEMKPLPLIGGFTAIK